MNEGRAGPAAARSRLALVSHGYFPRVGGVERFQRLVAASLARDVTLEVFCAEIRPGETGGPVQGETTLDGVRIHYLPWIRLGGERLLRPGHLRRALSRFDPHLVWAVHPSPSAWLAGRFARRHGRRWVVTYPAPLADTHWRSRFYGRMELRALREADLVITETDWTKNFLTGRGLLPERIRVVPLGPLLFGGALKHSAPPERGATPATMGFRRLLFVGGLDAGHRYKRPERLLHAIARLARAGLVVPLDVVGGGERRGELEELARNLAIEGQVRFLGELPDLELAKRYAASWALVLPSERSEGFGLVIVEAAFFGCPTILADSAASSEFWRSMGSVRVYPAADPEGLEEAIRHLWEVPEERERLANATARVREELDWERLLPLVVGPIEALLGPSARPAE